MSVQTKRKYDSDFKRNAVRLTEDPGRTVREIAENLGISSDLIYRWRRQLRENPDLAFPDNGKMALTQDQKRIRELEKKLKNTAMERDILNVSPSGYYRWRKSPLSPRKIEKERL